MITQLQLVSIVSILFFLFGVAVYIPGITKRRAQYCRLNPNAIVLWSVVIPRRTTVDGAGTAFICAPATRFIGTESL